MEISDAMIEAAQAMIRYLHHRDTPWSEDQVRSILQLALAAREEEIPDGWAIVPIEPTYEMCKALRGGWEGSMGLDIPPFPHRWKAMLAAAPIPTQEGGNT